MTNVCAENENTFEYVRALYTLGKRYSKYLTQVTQLLYIHTHTHTHTHIYIYDYYMLMIVVCFSELIGEKKSCEMITYLHIMS